jgi:hypothetical protein
VGGIADEHVGKLSDTGIFHGLPPGGDALIIPVQDAGILAREVFTMASNAMNLAGKVAYVTGGDGGLGAAICKKLAEQ